jgi:CBS domain-containing protein
VSTNRKPLFDLTAGDVMSQEVRTIHHTLSMPDAARLLIHDQISGVPVVDDHGRCMDRRKALLRLCLHEEYQAALRGPNQNEKLRRFSERLLKVAA